MFCILLSILKEEKEITLTFRKEDVELYILVRTYRRLSKTPVGVVRLDNMYIYMRLKCNYIFDIKNIPVL